MCVCVAEGVGMRVWIDTIYWIDLSGGGEWGSDNDFYALLLDFWTGWVDVVVTMN